ncbi:MAG: decaprenyl-phosphate phosphoribosyltransferase [Armatimonadota bacterium]
MLYSIIRTLRPEQWTKNILLFAGYLFTLERQHAPNTLLYVISAFIVFCLLSSASYILNDVLDIERDKKHPQKSKRPIAQGKIKIANALIVSFVFLIISIIWAFYLDTNFGILASFYFFITALYSIYLKYLVVIDLLVIASGFVIRAVAGTMVVKAYNSSIDLYENVEISSWLLICTTLLALFLGTAKRRAELISSKKLGFETRKMNGGQYTLEFLNQSLAITSSASLISYLLYTFTPGSKTGTNHPFIMITIPFVIYGIFRYLHLVYSDERGENPEWVLIHDKPLLINLILFIVASAIVLKL